MRGGTPPYSQLWQVQIGGGYPPPPSSSQLEGGGTPPLPIDYSQNRVKRGGYPPPTRPKNGQNMTVKPPGLIACRAICLNFRPKNGQNMT